MKTRKYLNIILIVLTLLLVSSCAKVVRPEQQSKTPLKGKDIKELEEKVTKMNQKLEEIYHRMSVIQFMVDNHERNFKDYDTRIKNLISKITDAAKNPVADEKKIEKKETATVNKTIEKKEPVKKKVKKPVKIVVKKKEKKIKVAAKKESAETLYKRAYQDFRNKRYKKAISVFNTIVKEHPKHKLANNALYWTGEIYYDLKKYETSIVFFKRLIKRYPKGNKVPAATLKIGYAFIALGNKKQAKFFLTKVVSNFPFSRAGAIAEKKLAALK